jgi:hypothetical protein
LKVRIGQPETEHVVIDVQGDPDPRDDYGWLNCAISIKAGAWSGVYSAELRTPDFPSFRKQVERLQRDPAATATFDTLEGQLTLQLVGDRRGHIDVRGTAIDSVATRNQLVFEFEMDQSYLPELLKELELIEQRFPANGLR